MEATWQSDMQVKVKIYQYLYHGKPRQNWQQAALNALVSSKFEKDKWSASRSGGFTS
jgi:hypothetical protein